MKKNYLHVSDFSREDILETLELAKSLKYKLKTNEKYKPFDNQTMAMIFAKPSARTRVSFETGFYKLGGHALYLGPNDIGIGKRESVSDIAKVLSRYNDFIMARLFDHKHILELAENATVPVINGLTDYNHPCQIMADIFTIYEKLDTIENIKITYIGDGNNIVHSWLELAQKIPIHFVCACPEGFTPDKKLIENTKSIGISEIEISHDPYNAVKNSNIIYTDVWASMGQKEEENQRREKFKNFQVNSNLVAATGVNTYFMHCLPAERGVEVTNNVCDSKNSIIFDQAENRMHAQNAIMVKLQKDYYL